MFSICRIQLINARNIAATKRLLIPITVSPSTCACFEVIHNRGTLNWKRNTHTINQESSNGSKRKRESIRESSRYLAVFGVAAVTAYLTHRYLSNLATISAATKSPASPVEKHRTVKKELPTYRMDDVAKHNSFETGIWVTYGIGVYDITKFVPEHPGSNKIMMGAGSAIDPFWHVFQQHNTPEILELLETFRIGNLNPDDDVGTKDLHDPWSMEPKRHPLLRPASQRPFNAEPPPSILIDSFITPVEFFYVRNHLPVPDVDINDYEITIEDDTDSKKRCVLRYEDLKKLPKHTITAALMCGGNRRSEMHKVKPVKGLFWGAAAVGNAVFSGPKLCDVLAAMGVKSDDIRHVQFEGLDIDVSANPYSASIPLYKAMDPRGDVILAYEMNGEPLTRDHGFPVRVVVPGVVGARNVKWLSRVIVSTAESDSHWQQSDYKGFSPSTDWDTVDFSKSTAIQNMPVTSAICSPEPLEKVSRDDDGRILVRGYAWSGGGNKIVRVDVTADGGDTWHVATLEPDESVIILPTGRNWSWTLWTARIPIAGTKSKEIEVWSKAVDASYNVQPETFKNTWNLRGVLSSAYCRVKVLVEK